MKENMLAARALSQLRIDGVIAVADTDTAFTLGIGIGYFMMMVYDDD